METPAKEIFASPSWWFKSYYVVWKLDDSEIPQEDNEGLNRTM